MRNRLTTFGHVAFTLGKIMVKEALTRTNSDLALCGLGPAVARRERRDAEVGGSSYRVGP